MRCPVCGEELETQEELHHHHHEVPSSWERGGAGFSCPTCGAEIDAEEDLVAHEALEHTARSRRGKEKGSRVHPTEPRDHRPPRHWPQG